MGGEPTFVSIDDMEGAEWNTAALGTHKRERAGVLLARLQDRVRARRLPSIRSGQVVPRRAAPALGPRLLLAWRRATVVEGRSLARRREPQVQLRRRGRRALRPAAGSPPGHRDQRAPRSASRIGPTTCGGRRRRRSTRRSLPTSSGSGDDLALALARGLDRPVGYALPLALGLVRGRLALRALELRARHDVLDPGELADGSAAAVRSAAVGARVDA